MRLWRERTSEGCARLRGRHTLRGKGCLGLSPAWGPFRPRPWPFISTASPVPKQWEPFGTQPSKGKGFIFLSSVQLCNAFCNAQFCTQSVWWKDKWKRQRKCNQIYFLSQEFHKEMSFHTLLSNYIHMVIQDSDYFQGAQPLTKISPKTLLQSPPGIISDLPHLGNLRIKFKITSRSWNFSQSNHDSWIQKPNGFDVTSRSAITQLQTGL